MSTVFVTSFPARLAGVSGKPLIDSYLKTGSLLPFWVYPEAMTGQPMGLGTSRITVKPDLIFDPMLKNWLSAEADVIPKALGGNWEGPCTCPNKNPHSTKHVMPCVGHWFCKHASRWFRKVVAWSRAVEATPPSMRIVWIDADTRFSKLVTNKVVDEWFQGSDLFYLKGPQRSEWEAGVIGFSGAKGREVVTRTRDLYLSQEYRKLCRWDDSYVVRRAAASIEGLKSVDLATRTIGHSDVVPHSKLGRYLAHMKGRHSRVLKIYT